MFYTIYKITNKINGKIYIGKHQTLNLYDNYYGSGKALINAIKKYGKENFKKEIIYIFDNEVEMNSKEKELITEEFVLREDTYNLGVGGEGGPHFKGKTFSEISRNKISNKNSGRVLSEEHKKKISESRKLQLLSEIHKKKISESHKGKTLSEDHKQSIRKSVTGKTHSDETKEKMRLAKIGKKREFSGQHKKNISNENENNTNGPLS